MISPQFQMHATEHATLSGYRYSRTRQPGSAHVGPNSVCRSTDAPHKLRFASNSICYKLLLPQREKRGLAFEQRAQASRISIASAGPPYKLMSPKINCPLCSVGVAVQRKEQSPKAADMNRGVHTSKLAVDTAA